MMIMGAAKPQQQMVSPVLTEQQQAEKPIGRALIVDEDYSVRRTLHTALFGAGFDIAEACGFDEAIALARAVRCDVALLSVHASGRRPAEICDELRASCPGLRILLLTSGDNERDPVEALDAGADDCIATPFRMSEVMARVRAAMRRTRAPQNQPNATLRIGEIEVNLSRRLVYKSGQVVHLTPKEFDLLAYLMVHAGVPIPHRQILTAVWGHDHASRVDYLRTFVRQLRRKLEDGSGSPRYLLTNNYIGYRFVDRAELRAAS